MDDRDWRMVRAPVAVLLAFGSLAPAAILLLFAGDRVHGIPPMWDTPLRVATVCCLVAVVLLVVGALPSRLGRMISVAAGALGLAALIVAALIVTTPGAEGLLVVPFGLGVLAIIAWWCAPE